MSAGTALAAGLSRCSACGQLSPRQESRCPRCAGALHPRRPESLQRTLALLLASIILYLPANLLPFMRVVSLGREQEDTILSGVVYFLENGSWPLALVIFVASILVPILKMAILGFLLWGVHRRSTWNPALRTRLYRFIELVGRWSMVDIFVVTLMVALVELGQVATIEPGSGALAFGLVVVATMLAAHSFDPRLIWDAQPLPAEAPSEPAQRPALDLP